MMVDVVFVFSILLIIFFSVDILIKLIRNKPILYIELLFLSAGITYLIIYNL